MWCNIKNNVKNGKRLYANRNELKTFLKMIFSRRKRDEIATPQSSNWLQASPGVFLSAFIPCMN
ncbi:CLUMA_CG005360, isoform A [Clunio marinus]|uniref:CLUMA_CG005360, isoform A n=1 Tax=Clunio marinus TaxID=568069 RepID=A0A1J1HUP2_9DIPT|nr:CLUMA_CG005360, isoform A [Clunio marinus]